MLFIAVYAVYAKSSLDTGSPLRLRSRIAVGTHQGVAGLAPRPFTLEEETGSHHVFMFIAPARSSACTTGAHQHLPPKRPIMQACVVYRRGTRLTRVLLAASMSSALLRTSLCAGPNGERKCLAATLAEPLPNMDAVSQWPRTALQYCCATTYFSKSCKAWCG